MVIEQLCSSPPAYPSLQVNSDRLTMITPIFQTRNLETNLPHYSVNLATRMHCFQVQKEKPFPSDPKP